MQLRSALMFKFHEKVGVSNMLLRTTSTTKKSNVIKRPPLKLSICAPYLRSLAASGMVSSVRKQSRKRAFRAYRSTSGSLIWKSNRNHDKNGYLWMSASGAHPSSYKRSSRATLKVKLYHPYLTRFSESKKLFAKRQNEYETGHLTSL